MNIRVVSRLIEQNIVGKIKSAFTALLQQNTITQKQYINGLRAITALCVLGPQVRDAFWLNSFLQAVVEQACVYIKNCTKAYTQSTSTLGSAQFYICLMVLVRLDFEAAFALLDASHTLLKFVNARIQQQIIDQ